MEAAENFSAFNFRRSAVSFGLIDAGVVFADLFGGHVG